MQCVTENRGYKNSKLLAGWKENHIQGGNCCKAILMLSMLWTSSLRNVEPLHMLKPANRRGQFAGRADLALLAEAGPEGLVAWLVACIVQPLKLKGCLLQHSQQL